MLQNQLNYVPLRAEVASGSKLRVQLATCPSPLRIPQPQQHGSSSTLLASTHISYGYKLDICSTETVFNYCGAASTGGSLGAKDPINPDFWNYPASGPKSQNVESSWICHLLGPYSYPPHSSGHARPRAPVKRSAAPSPAWAHIWRSRNIPEPPKRGTTRTCIRI